MTPDSFSQMKKLHECELVEAAPPNQADTHWRLLYVNHENKLCELKIPLRQGLRLLGALLDQAAMGPYVAIPPGAE